MSWIATLMAAAAPGHAGTFAEDNPVELGLVRWRSYEEGLNEARARDLPVLVLFDEVPGCSTVKAFGQSALSHPLLVDAAESLFVPVFVSNNTPGPDARILARFGEPAWNNPVVRFLRADGSELGPRLYGDWTAAGLAEHMVAALGDGAPDWLTLVAAEERAAQRGTETLTYGMYCFWEGEAALGAVTGVVGTRTGFASGEVVQIDVDPEMIDKAALQAAASRAGAKAVSGAGFRPSPKDDRHALAGSVWARVPMTAAQAARVNADVARGQDPSRWLSPRQRAAAAAIAGDPTRRWPVPGEDLRASLAAVLEGKP